MTSNVQDVGAQKHAWVHPRKKTIPMLNTRMQNVDTKNFEIPIRRFRGLRRGGAILLHFCGSQDPFLKFFLMQQDEPFLSVPTGPAPKTAKISQKSLPGPSGPGVSKMSRKGRTVHKMTLLLHAPSSGLFFPKNSCEKRTLRPK